MNETTFRIRPYSKRELARLYFPETANIDSAVSNLRLWILRNSEVMENSMRRAIVHTAKSSRQSRCASLWKLSASRKRTYRNGSECITIRQHPDLLPSLP